MGPVVSQQFPIDYPERVRMAVLSSAYSASIPETVILHGTPDNLTPQSVALEIAGRINRSWSVRFEGIPHAGSNYAPVEYRTIVTTFLEMDESPA